MLVVWAAHRTLLKWRHGQSAPIWLPLIMGGNRIHNFSRDGYCLHTKIPTDIPSRQRQLLYIHEHFNDEWITMNNNLLNIKTMGISQFQSSQLFDCVYPSGVSEFIMICCEIRVAQSLVFCVLFFDHCCLFVLFRLIIASFIHLRITASDYYWPLQAFHTAAQKL